MIGAPLSLALVLCACAFFVGRFSTQVHPHAVLNKADEHAGQPLHQARRRIHEASTDGRDTTHHDAAPSHLPLNALLDPLNPSSEQGLLEASGLLRTRPPLPTGASGDSLVRVIPFQILSWYPRVVVFPGFIDAARCKAIIRVANESMFPSGVAFRPSETYDANQQTRTSTGAYLTADEDPSGALHWLEERIAAASKVHRDHGEPFNVLHYEHMQHYDSHYDTFDPKEYGAQASQRIATVLTYLSVPEEGGETVFKREGEGGATREVQDWRSCDDGSYKYTPRQGDALLFWTVKGNQDIDSHALHGGCPVKKGQKWVATKWIRSKPLFGRTEA